MLVPVRVASVLMRHQVLIEHLLVSDLIVYLVVQLELDPIKSDHLLTIVAVVVKPVHFLVDHLHDLILVQAVEVRGMAAHDAHLSIREVFVANHILQA